jgi:hypothetical protein
MRIQLASVVYCLACAVGVGADDKLYAPLPDQSAAPLYKRRQ